MSKRSLTDRLSQEARALHDKSHGHFKTWFRKVWNVRGGGLYACGFAITFAVLEVGSIVEDFKQIGMLFDGEVIGFIMNFIVDSFRNTLQAFMWPVAIVQYAQPWGAIGLGLAFMLFPRYLKKHIEAWLFSDVDDNAETTDVE